MYIIVCGETLVDSEQQRVEAIIKNLESKSGNWKMFIGAESFTASQLVKKLGNDKNTRQFLLQILDQYVLAELEHDASRR